MVSDGLHTPWHDWMLIIVSHAFIVAKYVIFTIRFGSSSGVCMFPCGMALEIYML